MARSFVPEESIIHLTCAKCGQKIRDPFNRNNGPEFYRHRTRLKCDLIAIPREGRTVEVLPDELWEERLQVEIEAYILRRGIPAGSS